MGNRGSKKAKKVTGIKDGDERVVDSGFAPDKAILVEKCSGGSLAVGAPEAKVAKLLITECSNLTVEADLICVGGVIEVVNCTDVSLRLAQSSPIVNVENCTNIAIVVPPAWGVDNADDVVVTSLTQGVTLSVDGGSEAETEVAILDTDVEGEQWATKRKAEETGDGGSSSPFDTSKVVRDQAGFTTTESAVAANLGGGQGSSLTRVTERSERFEDEESLAAKFERLRELLDAASNIVVYTGAGVSTASNVPDFQGDNGLRKSGLLGVQEHMLDVTMPTYAHVATTRLIEAGHVQYVVTTNHDNIHRMSGTPDDCLAELFGNAYVEDCLKCGARYWRSVIVPPMNRRCDSEDCNGRLKKLGVRYGETVPEEPLANAWTALEAADLVIVLGSSLTTYMFSSMRKLPPKFVIANLQPTPFTNEAALHMFTTTDRLMHEVMAHFGVEIGTHTYAQDFLLRYTIDESGDNVSFVLDGAAFNEPCTCVEEARIVVGGGNTRGMQQSIQTLLFSLDCRLAELPDSDEDGGGKAVTLRTEYKEAYGEPDGEHTFVIADTSPGAEGAFAATFTKLVTYV